MDECIKLFRIRRTIFEMLIDRGYFISDAALEETSEQFAIRYRDPTSRKDLFFKTCKTDATKEPIFVFFTDESKVGIKTVRNFAVIMKQDQVPRAILVVREGMTNQADRELDFLSPSMRIEQFTETELLINITRHKLVPRHELITSEEEKQAFLNKYKLKLSQLPRINTSDPVARYYGFTKGQILKIFRPSETAGRYQNYRLVV